MFLYKLFLVLAIILIIALFTYPRVAAHAQGPLFPQAEEVSLRTMIYQYADSYGVNGDLAFHIANCESQLIPTARNPHSSARGIYQFLDSSWKEYALAKWGFVPDVFDPARNIQLGVWVLSQEGTTPWLSSISCWGDK